MQYLKDWIRLLRLKHWVKNLLVLFPLFFSGEGMETQSLALGVCAFLVFSFGSSFVYVLNDAKDVREDRLHPRKKYRPLASGAISVHIAMLVAVLFLLIATAVCILFAKRPLYAFGTFFVYIALNIAYSLGLKNKPVIDVTILALGFLLRVLFGGFFCGIPVSSWLFLTVLAISFFLALGKRRGELITHGATSRKSLASYTPGFLEKNMYVFLGLGLVFYSLWTFQRIGDFSATLNLSTIAYVAGIFLAILICLRYSFDLECKSSDGDPTEVLLGDTVLLILVVCWLSSMTFSVYSGTVL